jgi:DNA-binding transcriptional regulator YiaG
MSQLSDISPFRIREARKLLGMSRADLARACHVTYGTIAEWENSAKPIHIPRFSRLRCLQQIISLAPHFAARRVNPDWTL